MDLDQMKDLWQAQDRKLDAVLEASRRRERSEHVSTVRTHLDRLRLRILAAAAADVVVLLWIGSFVGDHLREPRFLAPGAFLHLCAVAGLTATVHQWLALRRVDLGEPVLGIQRRLQQLRVLRLKELRAVLALAPLLWLPMLIVALRGFLGVDAYSRFTIPWMIANLALGVVFLAAAVWASRRFERAATTSPGLQRLMTTLAGSSLGAAIDALGRLEAFEHASGEDR
jgi:hypothetical protein